MERPNVEYVVRKENPEGPVYQSWRDNELIAFTNNDGRTVGRITKISPSDFETVFQKTERR